MRSDFRITIISEDCSGGIINVHRWKRCRESEGKSAKRPGRSEGIKTFEIGSIKKEDPVDVKSEKEKKK